MDKLVDDIVVKAERAVQTVLNNMLPMPRCAKDKERCVQTREKVRSELVHRLGPVGPAQMK